LIHFPIFFSDINRKTALKNGRNYPADWKDKEIKGELKTLSDRINKYKAGEPDYPTENLIHDTLNHCCPGNFFRIAVTNYNNMR